VSSSKSLLLIPENPALAEVSSSAVLSNPMFPMCCIGVSIALPITSVARVAGMAAMRSIATTTDELENREISVAEIHRLYPKWAYGGGAGCRAEGAF
jgi:hypothetical protein